MDFFLTAEQIAIKTMAEQFSEQELRPYAKDWDEKEIFPVATFRQAASLGLSALFVEETYGGANLSRLDGALIFEALAQGSLTPLLLLVYLFAPYINKHH